MDVEYYPRRAVRAAGIAAPFVVWLGLATPAAADILGTSWTGAYIGAQVGMSRTDFDTQQFGTFDTTRAAFGGHVGYNIGLGIVVVGVEADAMYANSKIGFSTAGGGAVDVNSNWNGSVRARGGITVGPALLYATAGWAWTGVSTVERTAVGTSLKSSGTFDGVVYGIGAEAYVLPPVSIRFEALRYDYGTERLSVPGGIVTLSSVDRGDTVLRAAVTVHFR